MIPADLHALATGRQADGPVRVLLGGTPDEFPGRYEAASPLRHVSRDDPARPSPPFVPLDDSLGTGSEAIANATSQSLDALMATGAQVLLVEPFPYGSFDTVLTFLVLCSVENPEATLKEIRRVLAPGGRYLLMEHGLAPDANVQKWQRRINGVNKMVLGGCNLNRPIGDTGRTLLS